MSKVILALDLGTTGNRVIAFNKSGEIRAQAYYEFPQIFPSPGWVEHDPIEIWNTLMKSLNEVISKTGIENIESIGITNQRETTILWETATGKPVYNAIVWQCRRTADICQKLKDYTFLFKEKTGLPLDPYFSGTKIKWILDNIDGVRKSAEVGKILFGTVDSWILWKLTGGKVHATDPSNASRTLCYNIKENKFDNELLKILNIPENIFPAVQQSGSKFGVTDKSVVGREIPITGVLGDQQASLFAHSGLEQGIVKNTYGTGLFVMSSTGSELIPEKNLVNTIAWQFENELNYAIEGSIFIGGAAVQWLRDELNLIKSASETEAIAESLESNEGVYFVPALSGLGAPYWDPSARGMIIGITRGTKKEHFIRAALESVAYQTRDVIEEIKSTANLKVKKLSVDGGLTQNHFLMQFQADILGIPVELPQIQEMTAFGAAGMAGINSGFWSKEEFQSLKKIKQIFNPVMERETSDKLYSNWKRAVSKSLNWEE